MVNVFNLTMIEKTFEIRLEVDPPGLASVGQKFTFTYRIWGREVKVFGEHVEVIPHKMLKSKQLPQGMFKGFEDTMKLEGFDHLTRVTTILNYQLGLGVLGRVLGVLFVNRAIMKDAANYWRNVRRLAELQDDD